jgi:hypothetical protein
VKACRSASLPSLKQNRITLSDREPMRTRANQITMQIIETKWTDVAGFMAALVLEAALLAIVGRVRGQG